MNMEKREKLKLEIGDTVTVMLNYDKPLKSEKYGNYLYSFQIDSKAYDYNGSEKFKERVDKLNVRTGDFLVLHKKSIGGGKSFIEVMRKGEFDSRYFKSPNEESLDKKLESIIKDIKTPTNTNKEELDNREKIIGASWAVGQAVQIWQAHKKVYPDGFDNDSIENFLIEKAELLLKIRNRLL